MLGNNQFVVLWGNFFKKFSAPRDDTPFPVRADIELKAGMTITVDLPYIEAGWGAGHNEDLLLITDTSFELLHTEEDPLIVI